VPVFLHRAAGFSRLCGQKKHAGGGPELLMKERIRVLHVITRLVAGGADENTLATVQGLDKSFYQVDLLIGGQSDFVFASQSTGVRLIRWQTGAGTIADNDGIALCKLMH
jgi:hypothetical protein